MSSAGSGWDNGPRLGTPEGERAAFEYAVLRVVPRVDRGEFVNGAVLLYCQSMQYLGVAIRRELACVRALSESADLEAIEAALATVSVLVASGMQRTGIDGEPGRTFRWLTAPRSAVIQPGPVHTGVTDDPSAALARIARAMLG